MQKQHWNEELKNLVTLIFEIYLRHPSSVLSIFISRILETSSERTLSNIGPTPACWAEFLWTVIPVAKTIASFTSIERWEKAAINSSFQPALSNSTCNSNTMHYSSSNSSCKMRPNFNRSFALLFIISTRKTNT